jgi:hypothetical protein
MRKHEREQRRRGWRENGEPLDNKMISPLVSKVKRFREVEVQGPNCVQEFKRCWCSVFGPRESRIIQSVHF